MIGLDAAEPSALEAGPDDSRFPTLAGLRRRGAHATLVGLHDLLTDTVWPEIRTGIGGARTGIYYAPLQFRGGEARARALTGSELAPDRFYWNVAADAGARVAAIDQPLASDRSTGPEAVLGGWGTHDRPFGVHCRDGRLRAVLERTGSHPVGECNRINDGSVSGRRRLLGLIHRGIDTRTTLLEECLSADSWDLFTAAYGESHCVGHHYWPSVAGEAGDPGRGEPGTDVIEAVYRHLDSALGRVLAAAPASATVVVYASHGMAPTDEGAFLVGDVLERLGLLPGNRRRRRLSAVVPERVRGVIRRTVGAGVLQRAGLTVDRGFGDPAVRAVPLPNSRHGAVRLALAGRDPGGTVVAGSAEHRALVATIRGAFSELTLPGGEPVVRQVVEIDDALGPDRHPDLPDLVIRFRTDVGMITSCRSPRLGEVRLVRRSHRTGEHGTPGAVWIAGPGIPAGGDLGEVRTVDLAATALARLGVPIPGWVEGRPFA